METVASPAAQAPELPVVLAEFLAALRSGELHGQIAASALEAGYRFRDEQEAAAA